MVSNHVTDDAGDLDTHDYADDIDHGNDDDIHDAINDEINVDTDNGERGITSLLLFVAASMIIIVFSWIA